MAGRKGERRIADRAEGLRRAVFHREVEVSHDAVISTKDRILGGLWGSLIGDALGVPVEFKDRAAVRADPVTDIRRTGRRSKRLGRYSMTRMRFCCPS